MSFRQAIFGKIVLVLFCTTSICAGAIGDTNGEIRISTYNVENYLTMPRWVNGKLRRNAGKPEIEREAVTRMIEEVHPDVIGLMEIGEVRQLEEVQTRLRKTGIDYPYAEYLQGSDTTRHIAMLSRYPIVERHSRGELPLWVNGVTLHSPRGLLDVTIEPAPGYRLRILCVHLKAKLEVAEYDESQLRLAESKEIRRIVRDILRTDPATRLILMGDFNDTKNGEPLWQISGKPEWPDSLRAVALFDDRGESWTEYWSAADVYSRIDYILTAKKLEPEIDMSHSGIARPSFWNEASDHCALSLALKIPRTTTP